MLKKLYGNVSERDSKTLLKIYFGVLISAIILPIVFLSVEYFLNGQFSFRKTQLIFVFLIIWSLLNIEYFKKIKSE